MTGLRIRPLTIAPLLLSLGLLVAATAVGCAKKLPPAPPKAATKAEPAQSDAVGSVSYDEGSRRLVITLEGGGTYEYTDVPRGVYVGIMAAPARGVYFNAFVKDRYPSRLITSGSAGSIQIQVGEPKPAKPEPPSRGRKRGR